jgi:hypothetical protein
MSAPANGRVAIPVSAAARVAEWLRRAPDGPVRVLHHSPVALYLDVAGRCVGVVTPEAAQVPCALRITGATGLGVSPTSVLAVEPLSPYVERGTLCLTGHPLRIGRFVDVRVPRIDPSRVLRAASPATAVARPPRPAAGGEGLVAPSEGRALAAPVLPRPAAGGEGLVAPSAVGALEELPPLPPRIDAAILRRLVGNGGGLTPLGDDVLCGWLAVLVATDRLTDAVARTARAALDRTTLLSATLVECALHGEVLPEFAAYLGSLGTPAEAEATRTLTRIGHTSGAGLWWGARHALTTLATQEAA